MQRQPLNGFEGAVMFGWRACTLPGSTQRDLTAQQISEKRARYLQPFPEHQVARRRRIEKSGTSRGAPF
jgi:hypothetical protein